MELLAESLRHEGYRAIVIDRVDRSCIEEGTKAVHADVCYPAVYVIGHFLTELRSGRHDLSRTALLITQTGGSCRATNYVALLEKALYDAQLSVPVISLNVCGLSPQPGFKLRPRMVARILMAMVYGDVLMTAVLRTRPYEGLLIGCVQTARHEPENILQALLIGASSLLSSKT
jgi:predicted nucleotide-binding protein (sugar kinase/HSP70/actin superfamily)